MLQSLNEIRLNRERAGWSCSRKGQMLLQIIELFEWFFLAANFSCVDANMVTLRRRIEGVRVKESFMHTPEEWMEWERSCYNTYRADVNVLVATLQSHLLSMRPSVVLSIISLLFAIAPVAALLFFSALGGQLYSMNNALLDMLSSTSTTY